MRSKYLIWKWILKGDWPFQSLSPSLPTFTISVLCTVLFKMIVFLVWRNLSHSPFEETILKAKPGECLTWNAVTLSLYRLQHVASVCVRFLSRSSRSQVSELALFSVTLDSSAWQYHIITHIILSHSL